MTEHRAGFVTIVGRPNVGKSTLLNALLGEKLAIVTPKPQTTRDRILGIKPVPGGQIVFLDTPGVHLGSKALNRHMREVALATLGDVDAVLFVLDATGAARGFTREEETLVQAVRESGKPTVAVINKVDAVSKPSLLPLMARLHELGLFRAIVPVSATAADGLDRLLAETLPLLPAGPPLFPEDELTDRPVRFLVAELIREQVMLQTRQELPYSVAVEVIRFAERTDKPLIEIDATIHVERESQKAIVLGHGGERVKEISQAAREGIEALVGKQVFLRAHIRVEPDWTKSEKGLRKLGYTRPKA